VKAAVIRLELTPKYPRLSGQVPGTNRSIFRTESRGVLHVRRPHTRRPELGKYQRPVGDHPIQLFPTWTRPLSRTASASRRASAAAGQGAVRSALSLFERSSVGGRRAGASGKPRQHDECQHIREHLNELDGDRYAAFEYDPDGVRVAEEQ
jgi:hypothetical protein